MRQQSGLGFSLLFFAENLASSLVRLVRKNTLGCRRCTDRREEEAATEQDGFGMSVDLMGGGWSGPASGPFTRASTSRLALATPA